MPGIWKREKNERGSVFAFMETTRKLSRREKLALIGKYLRPCWGHFAAALLCACLAMVFNALTPQIIRLTVDSILGPETPKLPGFLISWLNWAALEAQPLRALWWAAAAVLLTALLRGVCSYGQRLQLARGSEGYVKGIRDDLYRHIQYLPFAWHKNNPTGDIIQRCTSDVDVIRQFVCNQLVEVVRTVFLIVLYLCIMFTMNLRLSLISALFIPIVGLSSGVFYRKISGRFQAADEAEGDLTTCAQENLTAVRVVRAFGRERYEEEKFNGKNQRFSQLWIRLGKLLSVYWASGTLLTCLQVMVIVVAGACECVAGRMTLGSFVAFVTYNEALAWPVRSLGRVLSDMSKAGVSMDRVGYILNAREERDLPDAVDAVNGDIVFDHVSFAYSDDPDTLVLKDVSFTAAPGETIALVGPTGAGKTTIVNLISRFYNITSGTVRVDGHSLTDVSINSLRAQMGVMTQDNFLFSGTIRDNIAYGKLDATEEEIIAAAKAVHAHDFIIELPDGYDTEISERGARLSNGQRQLLAFARTMVSDPRILILDEATSSIDTQTEIQVQQGIESLLKGRTSFIIAHRLSTIKNADRIFVIDHGKIFEQGTHDELMAKQGAYYQLYQAQFRRVS